VDAVADSEYRKPNARTRAVRSGRMEFRSTENRGDYSGAV